MNCANKGVVDNSSSKVLLDFYQGSYGPTLRIDVPSQDLLKAVLRIFESLAHISRFKVNFCELNFVCQGNVAAFEMLQTAERTAKDSKTLNISSDAAFTWANSAAGWERCVDFVGSLDDNTPGHQYLTLEGIDDALVEFAYLERNFESRT